MAGISRIYNIVPRLRAKLAIGASQGLLKRKFKLIIVMIRKLLNISKIVMGDDAGLQVRIAVSAIYERISNRACCTVVRATTSNQLEGRNR